MRIKRKLAVAAHCAVGTLLAGLFAPRATAQVNAIQTGNWNDPNTWDIGAVPLAGQGVSFPVDGVIVTSSDFGNAAGTINVASQAGITAGLIVTDGTLTTSGPVGGPVANTSLIIGQPDVGGIATFQMSGGTVNVSLDGTGGSFRDFIIGDRGATASGTMTGGTINAGDQFIIGIGSNGASAIGSGVFSITNATINTGVGQTNSTGVGIIDVGFNSGSGTMIIGAGALLQAPTARFRTSVGNTNRGSTSTVIMTDGTINVGDAVVIGSQGASTMTMSGGVINSIRGVVLSVNGSNVTTTGNNDFVVGDFNSNAALATLNISGTAQIHVGDRFGLGFTGAGAAGVVNQSGGSLTTGGFQVARGNGNASLTGTNRTTGIYNMSGGTITQTGNATLAGTGNRRNDSDFIVGQADTGVGIFNQSGGTVSAQNIFIGDFDRAQGTYNLSGGSLHVATDMYVGSALAANAPVAAYIDPTNITIANGQAQAVVALLDIVGHTASSFTIGRDLLANPIDRSANTTQHGTLNQATLEFDVSDAAGTTLIQVGNIADLDGSVIDLKTLSGFTPTKNEAFNLITASSFLLNSTTFAAEDGSDYTLNLVPSGTNMTLQAVFQAPKVLLWNQAGGTWDTNSSNQPWINVSSSAAASFSTGDSALFTDTAVGTVNITSAGVTPTDTTVNNTSGTYLVTGGGILGGTLTKSNAGTLQLANAANTFSNVTVNGGTLAVGTGTSTAAMTVTGTLNVADAAAVRFLPDLSSSVTHTIGTLNLNNTGLLDVANHNLLVNTPSNTNQIRQYLVAGYAGGNWNGTSGISSSSAANDATKSRALGYADGADGIVAGLAAGQTLIKSTIYGDADLNGRVQAADFNLLSAHFNQRNATWDIGDFDYSGRVTAADFNLLSAHFNQRVTAGSPNVASASASALTASPGAVPPLELDVDPATGDVKLVANVPTSILSYDLESSGNSGVGDFIVANWNKITQPDANNATLSNILATTTFDLNQSGAPGVPYQLVGTYDLGNILPAGLTAAQYLADLTDPGNQINGPSTYGLPSGSTVSLPVVVTTGVPEPTSLGLAGLAAVGLLGRRRRKA